MDAAPPLADGRYRLLEVLGAGGMATVYRGYDARLDIDRAVKVLSPEMTARAQIRQRFEVEARTMAKLHDAHIVAVQDVGVDDGRVYMVMELVEGGSLMDRLEQHGPMKPIEACMAVEAILQALLVAHTRGVVHRDIKPHNVLDAGGGAYKVTDFGIARVAEGDRPGTRTGTAMGTWAYMAPEQRNSAKHVDGRADLYATAATFYVLLTNEEPFDLYAAEQHDELFGSLPPGIVRVLKRAIRFRPEDRYANAAEMIAAVREARHELVTPVSVASSVGVGMTQRLAAAEGAVATGGDDFLLHMPPQAKAIPPPPKLSRDATFADDEPVEEPRRAPQPAAFEAPSLFREPAAAAVEAPSLFREPPERARSRVFPLLVALVAVCLLAGLVVTGAAGLFLWSQGDAPPEPVVEAAEPAPMPDAPVVHAEPSPVPAEASPEPVARSPAKRSIAAPAAPVAPAEVTPAASPAPVALDTVFVNSQPWAYVNVDSKRVGVTGWKDSLPVGAHQVRLETDDGRKKELSLNVKENDVNRICWDFNTGATCSR